MVPRNSISKTSQVSQGVNNLSFFFVRQMVCYIVQSNVSTRIFSRPQCVPGGGAPDHLWCLKEILLIEVIPFSRHFIVKQKLYDSQSIMFCHPTLLWYMKIYHRTPIPWIIQLHADFASSCADCISYVRPYKTRSTHDRSITHSLQRRRVSARSSISQLFFFKSWYKYTYYTTRGARTTEVPNRVSRPNISPNHSLCLVRSYQEIYCVNRK